MIRKYYIYEVIDGKEMQQVSYTYYDTIKDAKGYIEMLKNAIRYKDSTFTIMCLKDSVSSK